MAEKGRERGNRPQNPRGRVPPFKAWVKEGTASNIEGKEKDMGVPGVKGRENVGYGQRWMLQRSIHVKAENWLSQLASPRWSWLEVFQWSDRGRSRIRQVQVRIIYWVIGWWNHLNLRSFVFSYLLIANYIKPSDLWINCHGVLNNWHKPGGPWSSLTCSNFKVHRQRLQRWLFGVWGMNILPLGLYPLSVTSTAVYLFPVALIKGENKKSLIFSLPYHFGER